jgi:hypothetical protein
LSETLTNPLLLEATQLKVKSVAVNTPTLFILAVIILLKVRRASKSDKEFQIYYNVRKSINCYSCKDELEVDNNKRFTSIDYINFEMCLKCKRDEKIEIIRGFYKNYKINKLKKFVYSDNFGKIKVITLISFLVFVILEVFFRIDLKYITNILQFT